MGDKVFLSFHNSLIYESDLKLLEGRNWLNDSLISFWFEYLEHEVFGHTDRVLFVSAEVTQLLKLSDMDDVPTFLDPLRARHKDGIILAVNDNSSFVASGGSHWSLLVFCRWDDKWYHYDSQRGSNYRDARCLVNKINAYLDRKGALVDAICTQQNNSYDCGAFVTLYAQHAAEFLLASKELGNCFIGHEEANKMRKKLQQLIYSLHK